MKNIDEKYNKEKNEKYDTKKACTKLQLQEFFSTRNETFLMKTL